MAGNPTRKGGKKNRKYNRNRIECANYRASHTREKNKIRRIRRNSGETAVKVYIDYLYEVRKIYIKE